MRDPDEGDRIFYGHVLAVDVACPYVADVLFTLKVVLSDLLHGDRDVFIMLYLPLYRVFVLGIGIKDYKSQHRDHDEHIYNYDPGLFHGASSYASSRSCSGLSMM